MAVPCGSPGVAATTGIRGLFVEYVDKTDRDARAPHLAHDHALVN